MPDGLVIQSHKGPYSVAFAEELLSDPRMLLAGETHFLIDANVARLYAKALAPIVDHARTILIDATEDNKSLEGVIPVMERLIANKVRRDHALVAIGGGITQDITCFIASTLLRGLTWKFVPTTLLAQADSCIGSKSSINLGAAKNIVGTFNPPREIYVCTAFLDTLPERDIRSGIGEILKVHAIEGAAAFNRIAADADRLLAERPLLLSYVRAALLIKQRYIEVDEFDRAARNVFNYGHSFGHAIEAATDFAVPHGIAVTMGMDIANRVAVLRGLTPASQYQRMHPVLRQNYAAYASTEVGVDAMFSALMKDKKNTSSTLVLILPHGEEAKIQRTEVAPDATFVSQCRQTLAEIRA